MANRLSSWHPVSQWELNSYANCTYNNLIANVFGSDNEYALNMPIDQNCQACVPLGAQFDGVDQGYVMIDRDNEIYDPNSQVCYYESILSDPADPNTYTAIPQNGYGADLSSSGSSTIIAVPQGSCGDSNCILSSVSTTPSVVPQRTPGNTMSNVAVTLVNPAPIGGCTGRLRVEPVEFSGGHQHNDNRQDHTGLLSPNTNTYASSISIYIPAGELQTSATYSSGEVAGQERIIAETLDGGGNVISTATGTVDIKVPGLQPLGGFISYQLTGYRDAHPLNHYGTASTVTNAGNLADAYYIASGEKLGINDMSLVWGGLFDIGPPPASNVFWFAPHISHRKGTSVDIDLCALSTIPNDPNPQTCVVAYDENNDPIYHTCTESNYVCVTARDMVTFCSEYGNGTMADELTHHCEFPQ